MATLRSNRTCLAWLTIAALSVAGCAGGNAIDKGVPKTAFSEAAAPAAPSEPAAGTAAAFPPPPGDSVFTGTGVVAATGEFPNINEMPQGETAQMTDAQRDALVAQMTALSAAHANGRISPAQYQRRLAELRRLGATHSTATIRTIEE
ncbi:hypothetical protein [Oricola cellulosilytica]|uniref:SHOCT domain-containing protein n=1 Tax=Oricola cellulosilytica TaxID=1429082 RepID=A0A4R0P666_9HYPH|nr:hypothetical protein [Oricola cellulosilytica]TCD12395.1 hypothetical protein E0D97_15460 [Oricola cellulosilytica]